MTVQVTDPRLLSHQVFPDQDFPLVIRPNYPQQSTDFHRHQYTEMVIIHAGHGHHLTETESYPITVGDVFVIPEGEQHAFEATSDLALTNVLLRPQQLGLPLAQLQKLPGYHALFLLEPHHRPQSAGGGRLHLHVDDLLCVTHLLADIERALIERTLGYEAIALAHCTQLLVFLARRYNHHITNDSASVMRVANALSAIHVRYAEKLTLSELADIASMSISHFSNVFREATGYAPVDYLIRFRVQRAVELLHHSLIPVAEVGRMVGIPDASFFAREFKTLMGSSPSDYRRQRA